MEGEERLLFDIEIFIRGGKGVDIARRRLCRPRKFPFVKMAQGREPKVEEEGSYPPPFRLAEKIIYNNRSSANPLPMYILLPFPPYYCPEPAWKEEIV